MFDGLKQWLFSYWYNRSWDKLNLIANGPLTRLAVGIPLIGYLLLFNDTIVANLSFTKLTGDVSLFFLHGATKLRLVYFGLIFLAIGNIWYIYRRPKILKIATSTQDYATFGMNNFVILDFVNIFGSIESSATGPLTQYWEFGQDDLNRFIMDAEGHQRAHGVGSTPSGDTTYRAFINSRAKAIDTHGEFVRSLLLEHFALRTRVRRWEQQTLLIMSSLGYLLLAIPSLDLFCAVVRASF